MWKQQTICRFRCRFYSDTLSRDIEVLFPYAADTSHVGERLVIDHTYIITGFEAGYT